MSYYYRFLAMCIVAAITTVAAAQTIVKSKVLDGITKEPIAGATIRCSDAHCPCGCTTNWAGEFKLTCTGCTQLIVSYTDYTPQIITAANLPEVVVLTQKESLLQEVVVSANRGESAKRSEAPIAIATLSTQAIQDAKPITADQVLNKVSGVNMVNLGNEQHQMSIRQPMTTKSLFLYLEDGIPVRTTGLFNHNALLEMNMAAVKTIEVIKGPSSSLYGSEAIGGVVNFITIAPAAVPFLKITAQGNNLGYKRADFQSGITKGKWGFALSGYYADKRNGFMEYSDYHKATVTARIDYRFNARTVLSNSITALNYYSDMPSGVDSAMFATRAFINPQTFTYRKVEALRYRSTLTHNWNDRSKTTASLIYRNNTIGQNPNYRIKDDYRRVNGVWTGNKEVAHGEENKSSFNSYAFTGQHKQRFNRLNAVAIGGVSIDVSPSDYGSSYIRIKKDTFSKKYVGYAATDSSLTNYATRINNYAAFANIAFSPLQKLRIVTSVRYDLFHYNFNNALKLSAFSGSADTVNYFSRLSPKLGATYNFSPRVGIYANYSEGFVPPQVTEMYTGVKVPYLKPATFYNYEVGGWMEMVRNKLSADISLYRLKGTNEVVSVKLDDGSFTNQNAGKTGHQGIELGVQATPSKDLSFRFSGAYSKHRFITYIEKGISYSNNEMNNAPNWLYNTELWYKPHFAKGLRIGAEVQHVGRYYVDPQNSATYAGYNVLNIRTGYTTKGMEVWMHLMNATNNYYSYITTKSAFGYSYQLAEPRSIVIGVSYDFARLNNNK